METKKLKKKVEPNNDRVGFLFAAELLQGSCEFFIVISPVYDGSLGSYKLRKYFPLLLKLSGVESKAGCLRERFFRVSFRITYLYDEDVSAVGSNAICFDSIAVLVFYDNKRKPRTNAYICT